MCLVLQVGSTRSVVYYSICLCRLHCLKLFRCDYGSVILVSVYSNLINRILRPRHMGPVPLRLKLHLINKLLLILLPYFKTRKLLPHS